MEFFEQIFKELPYMGIVLLVIWLFIKYMRDKDDKFLKALEKLGLENRAAMHEITEEHRKSNLELVKSNQELGKTLIKIDTIVDNLRK